MTGDTGRFVEFYEGVFEATHQVIEQQDGFRLTRVTIGPTAELNVFELAGNTESQRQVPMFGRGRLDHLALQAASLDAFDEVRNRLLAAAARRTGSSPTSARSSACSSGTRTASRPRCASRTPTRSPACSTRPAPPHRATTASPDDARRVRGPSKCRTADGFLPLGQGTVGSGSAGQSERVSGRRGRRAPRGPS